MPWSLTIVQGGTIFVTGAVCAWLAGRLARRPPPLATPLALSSCRTHRIWSQAGLPYKLIVSLPINYDLSQGVSYPVLIALDAEPYLFPLLAVCARTNHFFAKSYYFPDTIIVGVVADLEAESRSPDGRLDVAKAWTDQRPTRARDYLPTAAESPWGAPGSGSLLHVSGHADVFCDFLVDTLIPFVDATYASRGGGARALIGKSFGGSGVAAALIHPRAASAFSEFILGSPSLAWDGEAWFRIEEERRVATAAGVGDGDGGSGGDGSDDGGGAGSGSPPYEAGVFVCIGAERDVDEALVRRFQRTLDARSGPRGEVSVEVIPGETHGSVSYPFVHHALDWLKPRWEKTE